MVISSAMTPLNKGIVSKSLGLSSAIFDFKARFDKNGEG